MDRSVRMDTESMNVCYACRKVHWIASTAEPEINNPWVGRLILQMSGNLCPWPSQYQHSGPSCHHSRHGGCPWTELPGLSLTKAGLVTDDVENPMSQPPRQILNPQEGAIPDGDQAATW